MKECTIENCTRPMRKKTYCEPHYRYIHKNGSAIGIENYIIKRREWQSKECIWSNCGRPTLARSLCTKHHTRWLRGHTVNSVSIGDVRYGHEENGQYLIPLGLHAKNGYAIVDKDFSWVEKYKWHLDPKGYAKGNIGSGSIFLAHLILGKPQKGYVVDHINRIPLDNRTANLRYATIRQNVMNTNGPNSRKSIFKGVHHDVSGKYRVAVMYNSEMYYVGTFTDEQDAAIAYDCAVIQLHDDIAYTNFIGNPS